MTGRIEMHDVVETASRPGVECEVFRLPYPRDQRYALDVRGATGRAPRTIFAKKVRLIRTFQLDAARRHFDAAQRYWREDRALDSILYTLNQADFFLDAARTRGDDDPEAIRGMHLSIADFRHHLSRLEL